MERRRSDDKDTIRWIQPSTVETDRYYSKLKKAYDTLHRFEVVNNMQSLTRELQLVASNQGRRSDIVRGGRKSLRKLPPASLRLLGHVALSKTLVPGACRIGRKGVGFSSNDIPTDQSEAISFKRELALDLTQAVAHIQRHQSKKGSPFHKVTMLLALERPILTQSFHAWDPEQVPGVVNKGEPPKDIIPGIMAEGISIMKERLQSIIDEWVPAPVISCDDPSSYDDPKWKLENRNGSNDVFQSNGFRKKCQSHSIPYDDKIESKVYGISEKALSPNQTRVKSRCHWTSKEVCTSLLSKERGPEDFFHLLQNEFTNKDGGSNSQPLISIIHMKAYNLKYVRGIKKDKYIKAREMRNQRQEAEAKRKIISDKIASADKLLAKRLHDELKAEEEFYFDSKCNSANEDDPSHDESGVEQNFDTIEIISTNDTLSNEKSQLRGYGWRKLPKSTLGADFFELNKRKIQTNKNDELFNRCNKVRLIGRVNAKSSIDYAIDESLFEVKLETKFIQDVLVNRMEVSKAVENQQNAKDKILSSNQEVALEHILNVPLVKPTTVLEDAIENNAGADITNFVQEEAKKEDEIINDTQYMLQKRKCDVEISKVLLAVKHSNYEALKEFIDYQGIDVDTYDEYGNTLFILGCQQGSKKMCKFLLRRGAYINAQNHAGNTGLHYLFEYGHVDLAEYIRQKGADDTYLNAEGLTCFEGVKRSNLDAL